jgi:flagellum-specific peptidoglycan hydrolase FlgJ
LALLSLLCSCGTKKIAYYDQAPPEKSTEKPRKSTKNTPPKQASELTADPNERYIAQYAEIAREEMKKFKIPASITLAQGLLESQSGQGELALKSNNHFGIKCKREWKGQRVYHDDDAPQECFRAYKHPKDSFRDHSLFLVDRERYADLFRLKQDDYKGWAHGLKKAGYATDPRYAYKLISLIERFSLWRFDGRKAPKPQTVDTNTYVVQKGDTLYSLSKKFKVSVTQLKKSNGLTSSEIQVGQRLRIQQ